MKVLVIKKEGIEDIEILKNKNIEIVEDNPEYIVTIGGDGTILKAMKFAKKYNVPIIPVNYGKIGYMAEIEKESFDDVIEDILNKKNKSSKRMLLECNINNKKYYALNEIVFKNLEKITNIQVYDEKEIICDLRADGLIISTPTGSTAYAMSAGGSIIHPEVKALNLVAIAPYYLGSRPLILPDLELGIKCSCNIFIDGINIGKSNEIMVKLSDEYIELVEPNNRSYYSNLKNKLEWR